MMRSDNKLTVRQQTQAMKMKVKINVRLQLAKAITAMLRDVDSNVKRLPAYIVFMGWFSTQTS